jgi:glutaredoxin
MDGIADSAGSKNVSIDQSRFTLFRRPGCPYCVRLRRSIRRSGVEVNEINMWEDPSGVAAVRSVTAGSEIVPTLMIGDRAMVNPSPRQALREIGAPVPDVLRAEGPARDAREESPR